MLPSDIRALLSAGTVIPAHPLALDRDRRLDERCQRGLTRYYLAAGAGGLAVGVHTTGFAIHDPAVGLYEPVLALAAEELDRVVDRPVIRVAGVVGKTDHAVREAEIARRLGYHAGLLSLSAMAGSEEKKLLDHCRAVAHVLPLFGFYLQPAVGGMELGYSFWRQMAEIEGVVAIKVAAFDRYRSLDVLRAVAASGRADIALYTGNDDNIVHDLIDTYRFPCGSTTVESRFVGGLLGHWAVWTRRAVELLEEIKGVRDEESVPRRLLQRAGEITDCNAAFFDPHHRFHGCIPGLLEVLRRQGLVQGVWTLDETEKLSPGQLEEIDRVHKAYPHLNDDSFISENRERWLSG